MQARETACPLCRDRVLKPTSGELAAAEGRQLPEGEPPPTVEVRLHDPYATLFRTCIHRHCHAPRQTASTKGAYIISWPVGSLASLIALAQPRKS